ncbi:hypothetical protein QBC40DRAFT_258315 [Triangularia verruculosa]|uniref:Uncharacterized protein n=1 Tax=Triangularia verruculosa TaxID=2587418 RepID=A0AAN7APA6_9PEZI|nr:hypothetical protein QBC40DRAFT_258315 [Triangularia verruculosa]
MTAGLPAPSWCILLILFVCITPIAAWHDPNTNQFRDWYPQYGHIFEALKQQHCMTEYQNYLTGNRTAFNRDILGGGGPNTVLTQPVIQCILDKTSDYVKNGMTAAQVLLGVMPTVLSVMGPSTEEMSMLANVARRPLLALMLAAGSPSVYFSRAFEYHQPDHILADHKARLRQWRPKKWYSKLLISLAQYTIAMATIANIASLNWEIGVKSICTLWTNRIFGPTIWAVLGLLVHILGTIGLRLRIRGWRGPEDQVREAVEKVKSTRAAKPNGTFHVGATLWSAWEWVAGIPQRLCHLLATEFRPSASDGLAVGIFTFKESKLFLVAAWVGSMATVLHIIFGTLIFASTIFVGVEDALSIVGRYMASVAICRIILMYELAGIREALPEDLKETEWDAVVDVPTPALSDGSGDLSIPIKQRVTVVSSQV